MVEMPCNKFEELLTKRFSEGKWDNEHLKSCPNCLEKYLKSEKIISFKDPSPEQLTRQRRQILKRLEVEKRPIFDLRWLTPLAVAAAIVVVFILSNSGKSPELSIPDEFDLALLEDQVFEEIYGDFEFELDNLEEELFDINKDEVLFIL